jgi:hypothetical protein
VAAIDARLARLNLPPVRTSATTLPTRKVALLWIPLSFGNPEIPRNHPKHFWPGGAYVDWVGTTRAALRSAVRWPRLTGVAP